MHKIIVLLYAPKNIIDHMLECAPQPTLLACRPLEKRAAGVISSTISPQSGFSRFVIMIFNHFSESVSALGWVVVAPTPAPYIKEMNDAGQFYTNRWT